MLDPVKAQTDAAKTAAGIITAKSDPDFSDLSFAYRFRDGQAEQFTGGDIPAAPGATYSSAVPLKLRQKADHSGPRKTKNAPDAINAKPTTWFQVMPCLR